MFLLIRKETEVHFGVKWKFPLNYVLLAYSCGNVILILVSLPRRIQLVECLDTHKYLFQVGNLQSCEPRKRMAAPKVGTFKNKLEILAAIFPPFSVPCKVPFTWVAFGTFYRISLVIAMSVLKKKKN